MKKEIVSTDLAPAAVGPYSQAVKAGSLLFISGQLPIDPESGEILEGDIQIQTRQVLSNIQGILNAAGSKLEKVVKTTVFITDMDNFSLLNEIFGEFFKIEPPARACVEVSKLPKGVSVEIEAIALI